MTRPQVRPHGELYRDLRVLLQRGMSVPAAAAQLKVSRATAYRVLGQLPQQRRPRR